MQNLALAGLHLDLEQVDLALPYLATAEKLFHQSPQTMFSLIFETISARVELASGNYNEALERLRRIEPELGKAPSEHRLIYLCVLAQGQILAQNYSGAAKTLADFPKKSWLYPKVLDLQTEILIRESPRDIEKIREELIEIQDYLKNQKFLSLEILKLNQVLYNGWGILKDKNKVHFYRVEFEKIQKSLFSDNNLSIPETYSILAPR